VAWHNNSRTEEAYINVNIELCISKERFIKGPCADKKFLTLGFELLFT